MRGKTLALAMFVMLLFISEASANGWVAIGTYTARGVGPTEPVAQAEAEAIMDDMVDVIAALYPPGTVTAVVDTTNWDMPFYEIEFTVYLKIF